MGAGVAELGPLPRGLLHTSTKHGSYSHLHTCPGKDGYTVGSPPYSGDYFVPGSPLEGWGISWRTGSPSGSRTTRLMKGLVGYRQFTGSYSTECFASEGRASATWTGTTDGVIQMLQSTSFDEDELFFTTSITITNTGSSPLYEFHYLRNVDPDQEQPHSGSYVTLNWVQYQPYVSGDPSGFVHPDYPDTALVMATGTTHTQLALGLGAVHPQARANHFGFNNNDPEAAWSNSEWKSYSRSSKRRADQGINLVFRFPRIDPGASISFTWVYVLDESDLQKAIMGIEAVTILQPSAAASGMVLFSASVISKIKTVIFTVQSTRGETVFRQEVGGVPDYKQPNGKLVYSTRVNTELFESGLASYVFEVRGIQDTGKSSTASSVVELNNNAPKMEWMSHPTDGSAIFRNYAPNTLTVRQASSTSFSITSVTFIREVAGSSINLGTGVRRGVGAMTTWSLDLDASDLEVYTPVAIKAVALASTGIRGTAVATGKVVELNFPPTSISLTSSTVLENKPAGTAVGTLSAADANKYDSHKFTFDTPTSYFKVVDGDQLVTSAVLNREHISSHSLRIRATDPQGEQYVRSFTISVGNVNEAPTAVKLSSNSILENSPVYSVVGTLTAVDPDVGDRHTFKIVGGSSGFAIHGGNKLVVTFVPDFEAKFRYDVAISATDAAGLTTSTLFPITITDVREDCCRYESGDTVMSYCHECWDATEIVNVKLARIEPGAFSDGSHAEVLSLKISTMAPLHIPAGAFAGLENMHTLQIWGAPSLDLEPGCLEGLPSLTRIVISESSLAEVPAGVLADVPKLTTLSLHKNGLSDATSIVKETSLVELSFAFNRIESLPSRLLHSGSRLKRLDLLGNPGEHSCPAGSPSSCALYTKSNEAGAVAKFCWCSDGGDSSIFLLPASTPYGTAFATLDACLAWEASTGSRSFCTASSTSPKGHRGVCE